MNWADERYVRVYTRDTPTWLMLPWQARAALPLIIRKCDRAGVIELGSEGMEGLAVTVGLPLEVLVPGVEALAKKGSIELTNNTLVVPKFLEAQETAQNDAARKRTEREKRRDLAKSLSRAVTSGHTESQPVTPCCAVPCLPGRTEPSVEEEAPPPPKSESAPLAVTITPPTKPPDEWLGVDFWAFAQDRRVAGGLLPERPPNTRKLDAWWSSALMTPGVTPQAMKAGFYAFGADPYWEAAGYPFAAFMSQWSKYTKPKKGIPDGAAAFG